MSEGTIRLPNDKRMLALAKAINETKTKVGNLNKGMSDRVSEAVDSGNINKPALSFRAGLMRTEELKAKERVAHFRYAIEVFEKYLAENGHAGDLVEQAADEEEQQRAAAERLGKENGAKVMSGIKPIPEKKGRGISKDKAAKAKAEEPKAEGEPAPAEEAAPEPAATTDEEWNAAAPEKAVPEPAPQPGNVTPLRVGGGRGRRPTIDATAANA